MSRQATTGDAGIGLHLGRRQATLCSEDIYRLCFLRGPENIIIGLAEQLS